MVSRLLVDNGTREAGSAQASPWRLSLLGGWRLDRDDVQVYVARSAQRLIALLALRGASERALVLGTLWPRVPENSAATNLRSALHRIHGAVPGVVAVRRDVVALHPGVQVDVSWLSGPDPHPDDDERWGWLAETLGMDLLPGWYDDWVLRERERIRQASLHLGERRAAVLAARHDFQRALDTALLVARADPMRESAQRLVMRIHLAEGNVSEAVRTYQQYADLLRRELDVAPSSRMTQLLAAVTPRVTTWSWRSHGGP